MIDFAAEVIAALRSEVGQAALVEALADPVAERVVARLDARRGAALEPLAAILGKTAAAARMVEARDPELRKLALAVGRRRLYQRDAVLAYLGAKRVAR